MLKKSNQKGFTIIEVLIVLAIAAVILIIIFFAVPALQRNSRNTQLRSDANVLLGFVNDYSSNRNGAIPTHGFYDAGTGNVCMNNAAVTACATATATGYVGKIRPSLTAVNFVTTAPAQPTAGNTLTLALGFKCNASSLTGGATNGRAAAVGFVTETAGTTNANQCIEG